MQTQLTHEQGKQSFFGITQPKPARNAKQYLGQPRQPSTGDGWMNRLVTAATAALSGASLWMFFSNPMDWFWLGASLVAIAVTDYGLQSLRGLADDVMEYVSAFVASGWLLTILGLWGGREAAGAAISVLIVTTVGWAFLVAQRPVTVDWTSEP